ncbi:DUF6303 family protein [Streptomyces sp. NPDC096136]|uniref:DUF6303 family protein n=1 Tax=Streptomyces sp. NPDC096136 TaxID=3366076 RepID=UPI00382D58A8
MNKQIFRAQLSLRCCGTTTPDVTAGPCWQLYVARTGLVCEWPTYTWPPSAEIPTLAERAAALADLGFAPAEDIEDVEGAGWEWMEIASPEYHPHPVRVLLLGAVKVRLLDGGAA